MLLLYIKQKRTDYKSVPARLGGLGGILIED